MRRKLFVFAVCILGLSVASGQWLESVIVLNRLAEPSDVCYNSQNCKVYTSDYGNGNVTVIDGVADTILKTIPVGGEPGAVEYNPAANKVYCATGTGAVDSVVIIDGATDTVIGRVPAGSGSFYSCVDPQRNKVYWVSSGVGSVVVIIDGAADTIIATITTASGSYGLCHNPQEGKVYVPCLNSGCVQVIDCAGDTIAATVPVPQWPDGICYQPTGNKVYVACNGAASVCVIDCAADTVVATVPTPSQPRAICANPQENKVYCQHDSYGVVSVIDGAADTLLKLVNPPSPGHYILHNPLNNKVFCPSNDSNWITVIGCEGDTIVYDTVVGAYPGPMCLNPVMDRVYLVCETSSDVWVFRDSLPVPIAEPPHDAPGAAARGQTIVRATLFLPANAAAHRSPARAALLDVSGRTVLTLGPGPNDVSCLNPGVYFVRGTAAEGIRKVVITK